MCAEIVDGRLEGLSSEFLSPATLSKTPRKWRIAKKHLVAGKLTHYPTDRGLECLHSNK